MANEYVSFYKKVKSPINSDKIREIIKIMLDKNPKERLLEYGKRDDTTTYDEEKRQQAYEHSIHYTNGEWYAFKSDAPSNKLATAPTLEHTFFLTLLKKDVYSFVLEYIKYCNSREIPFDLKIHEGGRKLISIKIYAYNHNLLETKSAIDEVMKQNPDFISSAGLIPLLSGEVEPYLGYTNEVYDKKEKEPNFVSDSLEKMLEDAFLEAFKSLYNFYKRTPFIYGGTQISWGKFLAMDIAKKIYDDFRKVEDNMAFIQQTFCVNAEDFRDPNYINVLNGIVESGLEELVLEGKQLRVKENSYPILKISQLRELLIRDLKENPNNPLRKCRLDIMSIPFEKSMERKALESGLDPEKPCFKADSIKLFEKLDSLEEKQKPERTFNSANDKYIYYALWLNNNRNKLINYRGKNISLQDYFISLVASYFSKNTPENYRDFYGHFKSMFSSLLDDMRNYGSSENRQVLNDEDIEFITENLDLVVGTVYSSSYSQRQEETATKKK